MHNLRLTFARAYHNFARPDRLRAWKRLPIKQTLEMRPRYQTSGEISPIQRHVFFAIGL